MSSTKVIVVGATGTIGQAVVAALQGRHEVIPVSRTKAAHKADMSDAESLRRVLKAIGRVDAIVSAAGAARFAPFDKLTDEDYAFCLANKLMGQVNLARIGMGYLNDGGSITLTTGVLAAKPMVGSAAISLVNCGVEGFMRAAALEAPRGIRVNVVSPPWVTETLIAFKMDTAAGKPAAEVAKAYVKSVEGKLSGEVIAP